MTQLTIHFDYSIAEDVDTYRSALAKLTDQGAEVTVEKPPPGQPVLPFVPVVLVAVLAGAAVLQFIEWWRIHHQYEQIITFRSGELHVEIVPIRNGKILVFADKDTVVEIKDAGSLLDLTEIAKAALSIGAEAASAAAKAAGAAAEVLHPSDQPTRATLLELAA